MNLRINSGKYRHRGELYHRPTRSDFRGDSTPKRVSELFFGLKPKAASTQTVADQQQAFGRYDLVTPWTSEPVTTEMFITSAGRQFEITGVVNVDDANIEWLITATEKKQHGR